MLKTFTGYCPVQNKDFSVSISYFDSSTLEQKSYTKGIAKCEYIRLGGMCNGSCPIIASAPQTIYP